ncbi:hypothetical protein SRB17_90210 [Streptomyces sp. RB17]|uniref:hypothetical protein n=1 Tax=Streptomyces sp. RB17 TaxID=2585197 RepID=UPI0012973927|nr:hypothetical protein [Streptomyces sp. RB17]MQY40984.1 hypothetical protein [Streptomyces sp. RB17]
MDLTGPGSGTDPELMERLQRQVLDGAGEKLVDTPARQTEDGTKDVVAQLLAQARGTREGEWSPDAPDEVRRGSGRSLRPARRRGA